MAEKTDMTVNDALNVLIPLKNIFRATEKLEEACNVVANLQGQKSAIGVEINELGSKKAALEKELAEITKTVNQARTNSKSEIARSQAEVDAKKKSTKEDIVELEKEYEMARLRANEKLAAQLEAGRKEVDAWTADLSVLQKKFHRMEADMQVLEMRKAQA